MCGRFNITTDPRALFDMFDLLQILDQRAAFEPRYNIAPSEPPLPAASTRKAPRRMTRIPLFRQQDERLIGEDALWPLVPPWAKGIVPKYSTANARAETLHKLNSFRNAWHQGQRCVLPATGFYEWQDAGERTKQPWHIHPLNESFFLFGGLWERSWCADGEEVLSCTIVTLEANPLMREIHNAGASRHRMPLILDAPSARLWLEGSVDAVRDVMRPFPADEMGAHPIGRAINNPHHDAPDIIKPLA